MSENDKQEQLAEAITDETKVLPLSQIDAQMKDAYKLLQEAQAQKKPKGEALNEQENSMPSQENTQKQANIQDRELQKDNDEAAPSQTINPLTLEEKRRQQRESKMTIEERRKLQRENPKALEKQPLFLRYVKQANRIDYIFMALLVIGELMNLYAAIQMMRIFPSFITIAVFIVITLLLIGSLFLTVNKRIVGFMCNALLVVLLSISTIAAYRTARFCDKVFHNTETQTVMIVAKKDADINAESDFNNIRIATVRYETKVNELAEALLAEKNKLGGLTQEFTDYQQAYNSLMNGQSDIMVYSPQIEQRLNESNNSSGEQIKVLFEHKQELKAVKAKEVNMKQEPFTILISGIYSTSQSYNEKGSSHLNILATINPKTKKMILQTIPSESWVSLECVENKHTKLAYAGAYGGMADGIQTLEKLYGITINYYVKINLNGIMDTVDALGGISVNNESLSCISYMDQKNMPQQICLQPGENRLDGAQALAYSRINQLYKDGEIKQNHQTAVINAIMKECNRSLSIGTMIDLFNAAEHNLTTNISSSQLVTLLKLLNRIKIDPTHMTAHRIEGEISSHKDEVTNEKMNFFFPKKNAVSLVKQRIREICENK